MSRERAAEPAIPYPPRMRRLLPILIHAAGTTNRNVAFAGRVIANVKADGTLDTLRARPGFDGRTKEGARIGDDRARIMQLYGTPVRQYADADWWRSGDIGFWFDGRGRVGRMYVRRR